jgi:hypothetical protein
MNNSSRNSSERKKVKLLEEGRWKHEPETGIVRPTMETKCDALFT